METPKVMAIVLSWESVIIEQGGTVCLCVFFFFFFFFFQRKKKLPAKDKVGTRKAFVFWV